MTPCPKITFGIIVLNGEPFTRYNLRSLYPFAHQIIVVEGACPKASHMATPDGHSIDQTLEILHHFKSNEDPEHKLIIVTAMDEGYSDGFWQGEKDEQSRAYAKRATGDWLWQVDIDEFYKTEDLIRVCEYLQSHPETTCLTFNLYHFWGGFDYIAKGGIYQSIRFSGEHRGAFRRVFKWKNSFHYFTHRPPTITDAAGRKIFNDCKRNATDVLGVKIYHYTAILPLQIRAKPVYYEKQGWTAFRGMSKRGKTLAHKIDINNGVKISSQFGSFNWLERFGQSHPVQIEQMRHDIKAKKLSIELRHTEDIEILLSNPAYLRKIRLLRPIEKLRSYWHLVTELTYVPVRKRLVATLRYIASNTMWLPMPYSIRKKLLTRR